MRPDSTEPCGKEVSTTIVVLHQGTSEELANTLRSLRTAGDAKTIVVGAAPSAPFVVADAGIEYISAASSAPAIAWNTAISQAKPGLIVTVNDKLVLKPGSIALVRQAAHGKGRWAIGLPRRSAFFRRSPLWHFLVVAKEEYPLGEVQDDDNVSGDFFHLDFCAFNRDDFLDVGGLSEAFSWSLFAQDFGRRLYQRGHTVTLIRGAEASVQYAPDLAACMQRWRQFGSELLPFWEKYLDSQVCYIGTDRISKWVKMGVSRQAQFQLEAIDARLRLSHRVQSEYVEKLQPLVESLAMYTVATTVLSSEKRLRSLLQGGQFSVDPKGASSHDAITALSI